MSPKEELKNLIYEANKLRGLDDITSKIISTLYVEPKEISLEDLSKKTGYSISAVSMAMKTISRLDVIKKFKKPKSRKVYFYMEKNVMPYITEMLSKNLGIIQRSKKKMPEIIRKLKKSKSNKEELKIAEYYNKQITVAEKIIKKALSSLDKMK
ncbi:MAG: winged helix-turn-helix transcriptional regulator [Candidatus Aenigmarchaeota archaeon]|nr:winged helix-turn-helix transcriptional regulator [Candidatus Aenigmarchaeota archaeon]